MKVLIIIPAYNEEKSIQKVIRSIHEVNEGVDVVVVNDSSSDKTSSIAKKEDAVVLDLPFNLGIGGAVQTGYIYALKNNYDIAIQIDGDGQHDPKYIANLANKMQVGYDMVIGSRFIENTNYGQTGMRMLGGKILSLLIKILSGKVIKDPTSGYRAVNKSIIECFANEYPYDFPEPDTTLGLILSKRKIVEIPVIMQKREHGESFVTPFKSAYYMIKVCFALFIARLRKY